MFAAGSSFHDTTFMASVKQLEKMLGKSTQGGDKFDKVQYEWTLMTKDGIIFTIYDWKEYRRIPKTTPIEWHIGGYSQSGTEIAKQEVLEALEKGVIVGQHHTL